MDGKTVKGFFSDPVAVKHYVNAAVKVGLWKSEEAVFTQIFSKQDTLLECGCGAGRIGIGLWELGYAGVMGIDFCKEMVVEARRLSQLLGYGIPFRQGDATSLKFEADLFDGVIFGFNGLMQIPKVENRKKALKEIKRVLKEGGYFVFTTHDQGLLKRREFWIEEKKRWKEGTQDPELEEYGDRLFDSPDGRIFMHIPSVKEIKDLLKEVGFTLEQTILRSELANEPPEVRQFSDQCRFWIVRKPN